MHNAYCIGNSPVMKRKSFYLSFWNPTASADGRVSVFCRTVRRRPIALPATICPGRFWGAFSQCSDPNIPQNLSRLSSWTSVWWDFPKLPLSTCSFGGLMQMRDSSACGRHSRLIYEAAWTAVSPTCTNDFVSAAFHAREIVGKFLDLG